MNRCWWVIKVPWVLTWKHWKWSFTLSEPGVLLHRVAVLTGSPAQNTNLWATACYECISLSVTHTHRFSVSHTLPSPPPHTHTHTHDILVFYTCMKYAYYISEYRILLFNNNNTINSCNSDNKFINLLLLLFVTVMLK